MKKIMMKAVLAVGFVMGMMGANSAFAHAHLLTAAPAAESKLSVAPVILDLQFSEGIEVSLSHVTLTDSHNKKIKLGKVATVDKDKKHIQVAINADLKPGHYVVEWRVVSVDSHKTNGKWSFDVSEEAK